MKRARQRPSLPSLPPSLSSIPTHTRHAAENTNKQRKKTKQVGGFAPDRKKNAIFQISIHSFLCMAWHGMGKGKGSPSVLTYHIIHGCIHTYNSEVCLFALPNERPEILPPPACLLACRFVMNGIITHPADPAMSVSLNARTLSVYLA